MAKETETKTEEIEKTETGGENKETKTTETKTGGENPNPNGENPEEKTLEQMVTETKDKAFLAEQIFATNTKMDLILKKLDTLGGDKSTADPFLNSSGGGADESNNSIMVETKD